MKKTAYILAILVLKTFVSCDKKMTTPSPTPKPPPVTQDTLSGKIYTIAGNGTEASSGDGGPATAAAIAHPEGVTVDVVGNVYIADLYGERIRKVDTSGIISTFAGNGKAGYSGDGGPAISAEMDIPEGLAIDASGNIYIVDNGNNCIRKVNTSGIISTYAGIASRGLGGYGGDGGPATAAQLATPDGLAIDGSGNLYIADYGNERIRKVNTNGIISTVVGNGTAGFSGDGGPATDAELNGPYGVAIDGSGNIYVADCQNQRIRKVNTNGIISTLAGNTTGIPANDGWYSGDGGPADSAQLNYPTDVVVDGSGNIYIADADNYCIRMVNTAGVISTYAGTGGIAGYSGDGGPATSAKMGFIQGIILNNSGNLYITDVDNDRVRIVYK